jgi:peptidoglycan/xylan/chitin deacetylase (PgdA/CDA1 family)
MRFNAREPMPNPPVTSPEPQPATRRQQGATAPPPRPEVVEGDYRKSVELALQDDVERERGIRSFKVISGDPKQPYVALTFDDGPHGDKTMLLLDTLKRLKCPATFFLVGMQARRYPGIVERMAMEGHEIGNHTYHHYRLPLIPLEEVATELNLCRDVLRSILGVRTRLVRPPGGEYNAAVQRIIELNGYANILWTDDPSDYKAGRTAKQIEGFVARDLTPGGIILLHSGVLPTVEALPNILANIRLRGLIPITVSELIQRGGGLLKISKVRISQTSAH